MSGRGKTFSDPLRKEANLTLRLTAFILVITPVISARPGAAAEAETGRTAPTSRPTVTEKTSNLRARWESRFTEEGFNAVVAPPFVIAGNGTPAQLAQYRDGTVLPAVKALSAQFFGTPPDEPVLIFLFESAGPYKRLAKKWFGEEDVPHYGFYRHADRSMLMNVTTGLGTLTHELTHALIASDFPDVPDWFNEGLASLYEQAQFGPGGTRITGLPNWRLSGLREAIKDGKLRPLAEMMADDDFRNDDRVGINYAQARYLMLYLQERGLLEQYYSGFRAGRENDATGLATLRQVIAPRTLGQFEKDWRAWVMTLRFGR